MKLSNRALITLAFALALGSTVLLGGFGPASWEGRKRFDVDGISRDTVAERLDGEQWAITCFQDTTACTLRADAVCDGWYRQISEEASDHDLRRLRYYRGLPGSEGGPRYTWVIQCGL